MRGHIKHEILINDDGDGDVESLFGDDKKSSKIISRCPSHLKRDACALTLGSIFYLLLLTFYCEVLHYIIVVHQCSWPNSSEKLVEEGVKAVVISDLHLRSADEKMPWSEVHRESVIAFTYSAMMQHFEPDVVFILGDSFDDGMSMSLEEFSLNYGTKLKAILVNFNREKMFTVLGNHEVGFSNKSASRKSQAVYEQYGISSVPVNKVNIKGVDFLLVDSSALASDTPECWVCSRAKELLAGSNSSNNSRPVMLQHVPFYRTSDDPCVDPHTGKSIPPAHRIEYHGFNYVLSEVITNKLLETIQPRVVVDGHLHANCLRKFTQYGTEEWNVAPFGRTMAETYSFLLMMVSKTEHAISRCDLAKDSTPPLLYALGLTCLAIFWIYKFANACWIINKRPC